MMNHLSIRSSAGPARRADRVLLIYPSQIFCPATRAAPIIVKTQLVKLHSYFRARGADTRILDLDLELGRPVDEAELQGFLLRLTDLVGTAPYDLVGISCYTSVNYTSTLEVARVVRRIQPGATVIVGGYHCLGRADDFADCPDIDHVVGGDGIQFFDAYLRGDPAPKVVKIEGKAPEPHPLLYSEYPYHHGGEPTIANVQLSRGCPFPCAFCSEPFMGNSRFVPMPVAAALAAIDEIIDVLKPDKIVIEDLLFGFNAAWRYEFLEALAARRYPQLFWVEMRADTITERTVALLASMNFELTVGLESVSPWTLRLMQKAKDPEKYIASFFDTARHVQRHGLPTTFSIMLNYPGETYSSYAETIANIERIQDELVAPHFQFDFFEFAFYPGNRVYAEADLLAERHGTVFEDREWYKRRDGLMLEKALCAIPSRALADHVGRERIHDYFDSDVQRIRARTAGARHLRSRLVRSWRFVAALRRAFPELEHEPYFSPTLADDARRRGEAIASLAEVHGRLALGYHERAERAGPTSWQTWSRAWKRAGARVLELCGEAASLDDLDKVEGIGRQAVAELDAEHAPPGPEPAKAARP